MAAGRTWAVKLHRRCRGSHTSSRSIHDGENIVHLSQWLLRSKFAVSLISELGTLPFHRELVASASTSRLLSPPLPRFQSDGKTVYNQLSNDLSKFKKFRLSLTAPAESTVQWGPPPNSELREKASPQSLSPACLLVGEAAERSGFLVERSG